MNTLYLKMLVKLNDLTTREEGQDLVEYALLVSLIAMACIVSIGKVATAITTTIRQYQHLASVGLAEDLGGTQTRLLDTSWR